MIMPVMGLGLAERGSLSAVLEQAFPNATKRTFIASECLATSDTLDAMLEFGHGIMCDAVMLSRRDGATLRANLPSSK